MKLFLLVFDVAVEDVVLKTLEEAGFRCYTKIPKALGRGKTSDPYMDTHIWPGYHVIYIVAVESEEIERLKEVLGGLKDLYREKGFKTFVLPLEEVL